MLKNHERVEKVVKYVVDHYRGNVEPMGYKAFLVGVDREACALYKKELDKHFPDDYSRVVYSQNYNDARDIAEYHLTEAKEKQIRKDFRDPERQPKILIVTEKLLTGFDAPILYCMYLDKPMRDHVLLQAIARVNRPFEDDKGRKKPSGLVLDFIGIFDNLEKALAFDSRDIGGVVRDIVVLKERFSEMIVEAKKEYIILVDGETQDKAVEAVLEHFRDEEVRHEFYKYFREISDIYDIISPDAFLRLYIDDMETLARMYRILKEAYEPGLSVDKEFTRKTAQLVREHTKWGKIKASLDIYELDEDTLKKIEENNASDTEKIFNLLKSIEATIKNDSSQSPFLIPIGERAEMLALLYKQRQKDTQATLDGVKKLIEEIIAARKARADMKMPVEIFTVYWILKTEEIKDPEKAANDMNEIMARFPYWKSSEGHEREIKRKLSEILLHSGLNDIKKVVEITGRIMNALKEGAS